MVTVNWFWFLIRWLFVFVCCYYLVVVIDVFLRYDYLCAVVWFGVLGGCIFEDCYFVS